MEICPEVSFPDVEVVLTFECSPTRPRVAAYLWGLACYFGPFGVLAEASKPLHSAAA